MSSVLLAALLLIVVPIAAAMGGAMYCAWARGVVRAREPWFTLLLACGLALLLLGAYAPGLVSGPQSLGLGAVSLVMLLFVRFTFGFASDLEEYGVLCVVVTLMVAGLLGFEGLQKEAAKRQMEQESAQAQPPGQAR